MTLRSAALLPALMHLRRRVVTPPTSESDAETPYDAVTIMAVALALLVVGLAARSSHGAGPERTYVVKPTDTLWAIAAKTYPGDTREGDRRHTEDGPPARGLPDFLHPVGEHDPGDGHDDVRDDLGHQRAQEARLRYRDEP